MLATTSRGHVMDSTSTVHRIRWRCMLRWTRLLKVHRFTVRRGASLSGRYVFSSVAQQHVRMLLLLLLLRWHLNLLRLRRLLLASATADCFGRTLQHRCDDALESILKVDYFVRVLQFCARFSLHARHFCSDDRRTRYVSFR